MTSQEIQSQIDALIPKAETGEQWAEICRLEVEMVAATARDQINAALAVWYPGEWPNDPVFAKVMETGPYAGRPWGDQCRDEMRRALQAAAAIAPLATVMPICAACGVPCFPSKED